MMSLLLDIGKNGVYHNLVKHVREAFEECELVRINCQGMNGSDYRKIGAKLKVCKFNFAGNCFLCANVMHKNVIRYENSLKSKCRI